MYNFYPLHQTFIKSHKLVLNSMHIYSHTHIPISQKARHPQDTDRIQCNHQSSNYIQGRPMSAGPILHLSVVYCSTAKIPW